MHESASVFWNLSRLDKFKRLGGGSVSLIVAGAACLAGFAIVALLSDDGLRAQDHGGGYLAAWSGDEDREDSDFLAVINVDSSSLDYGQVVSTSSVGERSTNPHHTEYSFTAGHPLFASGFAGNRMFRFDLSNPLRPRFVGAVETPSALAFSHSLERLPNGNVLVTMQARNEHLDGPGGMAEFRDDGTVVQWASADADVGESLVRPYSLAPVPGRDRLVTASSVMGVPPWHPKRQELRDESLGFHLQLWRLSDLSLLSTVALTASRESEAHLLPYEPRLLDDGETVLVTTSRCGLWRVRGLEIESFTADLVYDFEGRGCAVPLSIGRFWIQSIASTHQVVVLDVGDSGHPVEVSRVQFNERQLPHWLAFDERESRVVMVNAPAPLAERRIWMLDFDAATGQLTLDERFRDVGSEQPGVNFDRIEWPHGPTGSAIPHGSVFLN